jgi:hypothetical protein
MMGSLTVIPKQPINKVLVKGGHIITKERSLIDKELFREGSVKPFNMGIHLRSTRIRMIMRQTELLCGLMEVFGKL